MATLGARRNVLERRLRSILLNFIRFDNIRSPSQGLSVRQRIVRGIRERRRKELEHLSAEDIVSRFTWNELADTIGGKEWVLFEQIFGDKRRFREMTDLVVFV